MELTFGAGNEIHWRLCTTVTNHLISVKLLQNKCLAHGNFFGHFEVNFCNFQVLINGGSDGGYGDGGRGDDGEGAKVLKVLLSSQP